MVRFLAVVFGRTASRSKMGRAGGAEWWRRYPGAGSRLPQRPGPEDRPDAQLRPGAWVRLVGKPDRVRRVLKREWHRHRGRFVYVVETSARPAFEPYWFADQLEVAAPGTEAPG